MPVGQGHVLSLIQGQHSSVMFSASEENLLNTQTSI